jgi:hypothetical protein
MEMASEIALSSAGDGLLSHAAILRAARMDAAMRIAPLRIWVTRSDTAGVYHIRFLFAIGAAEKLAALSF